MNILCKLFGHSLEIRDAGIVCKRCGYVKHIFTFSGERAKWIKECI